MRIIQKGFVLIEMIIYTALFSIMIGGLIIVAFQLIHSGNRTETRVTVQEEMNFILKKIDWALTGASDINIPNDYTLEITNPNITGVIVFQYNSANKNINMKIGGGSFEAITTINVHVENTVSQPTKFELVTGTSTIPEGVKIFINIDEQTTNFSKYLKYVP